MYITLGIFALSLIIGAPLANSVQPVEQPGSHGERRVHDSLGGPGAGLGERGTKRGGAG